MTTAIKVINTALILFAVFMGIKQGWAMTSSKQEMLTMFDKWNVGKSGVVALGVITILGSLLVLYPKTFLWGNFIMAGSILFIITLELNARDLKGAAIEMPFFLLSLVILYLRHPPAPSI